MALHWMRRAWLVAASASALLLAACGGGTVDSQFSPDRVVAFGDAMGDLGQAGSRYTVNDGTVNNWTQFVASQYGRDLAPSAAGGLSYATGNARVTAKPDAAGNSGTRTVKEQIDAFLAGNKLGGNDLVMVSAGTSDVITQARLVLEGSQTQAEMQANLEQAGRDLAEQVKRLVSAGATHVVVAGPFNLGRSPWARQTASTGLMEAASTRFNGALLVALVDYGRTVLYVDAALYFNNQTADGGSDFSNRTEPVCTSVDAGPGIGTGNGQVNSSLCTTSTLVANANPAQYVFADRVYPTPRAHQLFGDYAKGRIRDRW
ncbi:SGNH/GDSL hydrolase family protein [Ramlibacter sp. USB13]|uniref:SGNH/GDSL hydrolase family protein n=1 Tax=Ramlibacter cellulosilyticus TaxID=2764187 RepID=A0A923MQR4_9BURK|nr:SGNH/GDSL hydrolase family protein [Ramlibacter cellulosilyticus]MBC5782849.1 SGNH/GDSL hydrolase family protein [Ramlibacter cellulosilyticus]